MFNINVLRDTYLHNICYQEENREQGHVTAGRDISHRTLAAEKRSRIAGELLKPVERNKRLNRDQPPYPVDRCLRQVERDDNAQ
jgi:hypothetical protein